MDKFLLVLPSILHSVLVFSISLLPSIIHLSTVPWHHTVYYIVHTYVKIPTRNLQWTRRYTGTLATWLMWTHKNGALMINYCWYKLYSHLLLLANMKQSLSLQYNKVVNSSTTRAYIVIMISQHPHNMYSLQSDISFKFATKQLTI